MADEAVMDAAVETAPEQTTEVEESSGEPTGLETPESQEVPQDQTQAVPDKPLIDGGKLSAEAKATLEKIKAENPALARAIQRALFKEAEFARELPNGLKDVKALRDTVEQLGGEHGIQEITAEVNGWHQFDEQYMAGKPEAIDFMTSEPEGQEAFLKLIPHALQKFEQLHPDGFRNYMAQVMEGSIASSGIPLALERLADFIGDNPKAIEQWNKIAGFVKFVGDTARKQVEAPKFANQGAPDNERTQFEQERSAFEREKWKNETATASRPVFESEWNRLVAGRKLTAEQDAAIKELFESRFSKAINGQHAQTLQRYFDAKDKQGFMKYAAKLDREELPKALRAAFDTIMPGKPGPRPGSAPAPKNGAPAPGMPIAQGFVQVAKQPATSEIDFRNPFNNAQNFQAGKAILTNGKRVQWQKA